jgi:peptide/nickel transport system substrate-binding protein
VAAAEDVLRSFEAASDADLLLDLSHRLQRIYVDAAPSLPLFPSPLWGVYSLERLTGFPSRFRPFGSATPSGADSLPVLVALEPR